MQRVVSAWPGDERPERDMGNGPGGFADTDEAVADVHRVASPVIGTKRTGKMVRLLIPASVFSTTMSC